MTKPANFPERRRQRQLKALFLRQPVSDKGNSNAVEIAALNDAVAGGSQRDRRTKKFRGARRASFKAA